jgi:hypothetical protein
MAASFQEGPKEAAIVKDRLGSKAEEIPLWPQIRLGADHAKDARERPNLNCRRWMTTTAQEDS